MKLSTLIGAALLAVVVVGCGGATDGAQPTPPATAAPTEAPPATPDSRTASGAVGPGKSLHSKDGVLEVAGTGGTELDVTVRELGADAPAAPRGWTVVGDVYEVTAIRAGETIRE